tara:strand:+ start:6156 stop:6830 length:675 start_codon:yes stop_codon:yes gene_type:complete
MSIESELIKEFTECEGIKDKLALANKYSLLIHKMVDAIHPVGNVTWVPITDVEANDYNPNAVADTEMQLLYTSISHDGYTQPVVTIYDADRGKYVIVDGFHRYSTMRRNKDIMETTDGMLPVVVIDKDINDRMASTVRHNRARGKHSVSGMGNMVFEMLDNGWTDEAICSELGMSADELVRLKHVTGFSKLFENVNYRKSWEMKQQLKFKKEYKDEHPEEPITV